MNEFLHGVWQQVTVLRTRENYVEPFDINVHIWRESKNIQVIALFSVRFIPPAPDLIPYFDLYLPGPPSHTKVQTCFYASHERDGETWYSPGFAEVDQNTLRMRAFPFRGDSTYTFNFSFFYFSAQ
jgi:hypothetical protein